MSVLHDLGVPSTPLPKESLRVYVELSLQEVTALKMAEKRREVRSDALHFLKDAIRDLGPEDMIVEHAKRVYWTHWNYQWEGLNATIVLTKKVYDIFSKRSVERGLFPRLFFRVQTKRKYRALHRG